MSSPDEALDDFEDGGPDELLVAYLDGQLDAEECERLESRLAEDEPTRERLQTLDRVWNALDALPRSTASPSFTRSTVEMAAVTAVKPAAAEKVAWRLRAPAWFVVSIVAALLSAAVTWGIATAPERRALRDLPIALHASALEQAVSIEFLEAFAEMPAEQLDAFRTDELTRVAAEWHDLSKNVPHERGDWVAALSAADLAKVNDRVAVYQSKPAVKRQSIVAFSDELSGKPNAASLREMALVYESMVERLPASEQLRLRQMEAAPRLRAVQRQAGKWARQRALDLTDVEKQRFRRAIEEASKDGAFAELLQSRLPGMPTEVRDRVRKRPQIAPIVATGIVARTGGRVPPPFEGSRRGERFVQQVLSAWRDWFAQARNGLPDRVQAVLEQASSEQNQARLFMELLRNTGTSDLSAIFSELPNQEIDDLLLLPKEEFAAALSEQLVGGDLDQQSREGRPRFDRPPGPPTAFESFRDGGPPGNFPRFDDRRRHRPPGSDGPRDRGRPRPNGE